MSNTFSQWKRKYKKACICKTVEDVSTWLSMHHILDGCELPDVVSTHGAWSCEAVADGKVLLKRTKLILHVDGFRRPYIHTVLSPLATPYLIKREYFSIFGNICRILHMDTRNMEQTFGDRLITQRITITASVKSQYKEERCGHTIRNFYRNVKRRTSLTGLERGGGGVDGLDRGGAVDGLDRGGGAAAVHIPPLFPKVKQLSLDDLRESYRWSTPSYHQKLVHYFTENIPRDLETPRLVLMFGVPGSGKNWLLRRRRKRNHVIINVDDCLAMLPDYWRGLLELQEKDKNAHDWIRTFRKECHTIADRLFLFALRNRMNIVWNGTGKNVVRYRNLARVAKERGYVIELNGVCVPLQTAKRRVNERRDSYGRSVPDAVFNTAAMNIPASFQELRGDADYARIWQNTKCDTPKIIWDKQQGWLEANNKLLKDSGWIRLHSFYSGLKQCSGEICVK